MKADLTIHNSLEPDGSVRYCYMDGNGNVSPNLRLKPGDLLILHLKNDLTVVDPKAAPTDHMHAHMHGDKNPTGKNNDPCVSGAMTATSTNLHFHGLTIPPVCHQDDVLKTSMSPHDPPFEYRFRIPADEPPGLYWYHPHIHGFSKAAGSGRSVGRAHRRRNRAREQGSGGIAGASAGYSRPGLTEPECAALEIGARRAQDAARP